MYNLNFRLGLYMWYWQYRHKFPNLHTRNCRRWQWFYSDIVYCWGTGITCCRICVIYRYCLWPRCVPQNSYGIACWSPSCCNSATWWNTPNIITIATFGSINTVGCGGTNRWWPNNRWRSQWVYSYRIYSWCGSSTIWRICIIYANRPGPLGGPSNGNSVCSSPGCNNPSSGNIPLV